MELTLTLKEIFFIVLIVGLVFLFINLSIFLRNAIISLKSINKILEDTQIISEIASQRTKDINELVEKIIGSITIITDKIISNKNTISLTKTLLNSLNSIKKSFSKSKD